MKTTDMKTTTMTATATARGASYAAPQATVITIGANRGFMEILSIPVDPDTPATGDGNAKASSGFDEDFGEPVGNSPWETDGNND